uniref:Uncharacterized protein n=1 Tax=Loa loa TaxID=7209 RepID=A0A1I7VUC6_LOALO
MLFQDFDMFRIIFTFVISLIYSCVRAHLAGFSSVGPISPYIGSIPALVNAKTYDQILQKIVGRATNYSNGFFWPPPPALVAEVLEKEILQSSGFDRLGLRGLNLDGTRLMGGLGLNGFGLGLNRITSIGFPENPSNLGFMGGIQVIQIPLSPSSSALQQCHAPCFVCSSQAHTSSCTELVGQPKFMFSTVQTSISPLNQCCCCIGMNK